MADFFIPSERVPARFKAFAEAAGFGPNLTWWLVSSPERFCLEARDGTNVFSEVVWAVYPSFRSPEYEELVKAARKDS